MTSMRKARGRPAGATTVYTPDVCRDDPEPVKVHIKQITEGERRRVDWDLRKEKEKSSLDSTELTIRAYFLAMITCVENYLDNRGEPILTAQDLWDHGESEIVWDVVAEIQRGLDLTTEEKKV